MKVLITGAHFTPAQAVIEELQKYEDFEIVYIGRKYTREGDNSLSAESQILPKLNVKFLSLTTGRLRTDFSIHTLLSYLKIPLGFIQAFYFVMKESPNLTVSFGGYIAVPVVFASWLLNIPVIIHEQTLVSGIANSVSSLFANIIAVTFKTDYKFPKEKILLTGNPMRQELFDSEGESVEIKKIINNLGKLPLILITGGNQGSHAINQVVKEILPELLEKAVVIHQTGDSSFKDYEQLQDYRKELKHPNRYLVQKFISASDLGLIFKNSDVAISRSGANTLLELSYFQIPTIMIPFPFVRKNEQVVNARFFKKHGLGELIEQKELNSNTLLSLIQQILNNHKKYKDQAASAREVVILDAAPKIVQQILLWRD